MSPARGPGPVSRAAAPRAGGRGLPVLLIAFLALIAAGRAADRATTIVGADLADGSGAPLRRANVRFVNDRIVERRRHQAAGRRHGGRRQGTGRRARLHRHPQSLVVRAGGRSRRRDADRAGHHDGRRRTGRRFAVADRRLPVGAAERALRRQRRVVRRSCDRAPAGDEGRLQARRARRRNRAHGAARRSGDARRRRRLVERPRIRSRRLRARRAS